MADVKNFFCCIAGYEKISVWEPHPIILINLIFSYNLKCGYTRVLLNLVSVIIRG